MKRSKLSGAQYKKSRQHRQEAAEKYAVSMSRWLSQASSHVSGSEVGLASTAAEVCEASDVKHSETTSSS